MGQRANLITVEDGEYTLRYDHWCANRLDDILFWGPGHALDYFDAQDKVGEEGWLDEIWAEGGAVLDLDKKYLIWWGGEDILYDLPRRRVYLKLQEKIWNGWIVEWAHRGIVDLAEYVRYPKENVLTDRNILREPTEIRLAQGGWNETVGAIKTIEGNSKLFVLPANVENYLFNGVDLVDQCKAEKGLEKLVWEHWRRYGSFPTGGFWIDEERKTMEFWAARTCPNVVQDLKRVWDDWDVEWHRDNYEFLVDKMDGELVLPETHESELVESLRKSLLRDDGKPGLGLALDTNETLRGEGLKVEINPWLFKSHHVKKPLESKIQIWQKNFGE